MEYCLASSFSPTNLAMAPADGKSLPTSREPGWFIHVSISEQTNQQNTYNHIIMYDSCMYINISLYVHLSFELASTVNFTWQTCF